MSRTHSTREPITLSGSSAGFISPKTTATAVAAATISDVASTWIPTPAPMPENCPVFGFPTRFTVMPVESVQSSCTHPPVINASSNSRIKFKASGSPIFTPLIKQVPGDVAAAATILVLRSDVRARGVLILEISKLARAADEFASAALNSAWAARA